MCSFFMYDYNILLSVPYSDLYLFLRFGRKMTLGWCLLQLAIADTCAAIAPTFLVYCSLRFLAGLPVPAIIANTTILGKSTLWILYILT